MDKEKILTSIKNAQQFAKSIEDRFPKSRNTASSIEWALRDIKKEVENSQSIPRGELLDLIGDWLTHDTETQIQEKNEDYSEGWEDAIEHCKNTILDLIKQQVD